MAVTKDFLQEQIFIFCYTYFFQIQIFPQMYPMAVFPMSQKLQIKMQQKLGRLMKTRIPTSRQIMKARKYQQKLNKLLICKKSREKGCQIHLT